VIAEFGFWKIIPSPFSPGIPTISAKLLDIILGVYWMTKEIPGESGDQLISTGQNNGGDKKYTLTNSYTGESKSEDAKSAKQEMETRQPKSCCIKAAQTQIGIICVTTIGQPVKQFGELKGGRNFGHKSRPTPTTPSHGFIQKLNAVINF
jgi:hypothetical protein